MSVPWQQIASSVSSLVGNAANWQGARRASAQEKKQLQRAQQIQQRNLLMNLGMYDPNRALGYGAMSDLATLYGYSLPEYQTAQDLAATTTPLSPKVIKQYRNMGMSLEDIRKLGTLATPSKKQLKKLRKAGLTAEDIKFLMTTTQNSDYGGPLSGTAADGTAAAEPGNMSRFFTSPDYQFRLSEGQRNIGNSFAARGGAASGNALRALTEYNQGMASGEYGNYVNRLMAMAGIGTNAQNQISGVGTNTANNMSNYQAQIGDAQAASALGQYGALAQHAADLGNIWGSGGVGASNPNASGVSGGLTQGQMSGQQLMPAFANSGFGSGFASYFSDVRVKRDIERVGQTPGGHNLYKFHYVWEPDVEYVGVLAQEVERITPEAVSEVDGIKCVDYGRIL